MRRVLVLLAALAAALGGLSTAPAAEATADGPFCGITWGSLPKESAASTSAPVVGARAGRHDCWDRLVIDLGAPQVAAPGQSVGYDVQYVPVVTQDGSGEPVPLDGGAFLQITVRAPAHTDDGRPTYVPADRLRAVDVAGFRTFRQVAFLGDFEAVTTFGLGVRARLPFRVFVLAGPDAGSRLVIDVAHRW